MADKPWYKIDSSTVTEENLPSGFVSYAAYADACNLLAEAVLVHAIDAHPSWEHGPNRTFERVGRTGPRTPERLRAWFVMTHPKLVEGLAGAARVQANKKYGMSPPVRLLCWVWRRLSPLVPCVTLD